MAGTVSSDQWRNLLAVGLIAGDLSARGVAHFARVAIADATRALRLGADEGLVVDGAVPHRMAAELIDSLPPETAAEVHARVARHLIAQGPSRLVEALSHARAAGGHEVVEEITDIADHAGRMSLSIGDYESANALFELADDAGVDDSLVARADRLMHRARALEGLGLVNDAREVLARAFDLADRAGEADLAADIAVAYAFPADWYAGDVRATALLQRAADRRPSAERLARIHAARAVVDMRIPIPTGQDHQLAWVTRASVAQPLAAAALKESEQFDPNTRLLALLAWRTTHRAPRHLEQRRERSTEALDLAQRLRIPGRQVDSAVMLAVDSIESGDRAQFDRALSVLRWVAERDGNRRLHWHTFTVAAGISFMDGDVESAERYRLLARDAGMSVNSPGWFGAELILLAQSLLASGDLDQIRAVVPPGDTFEWENPIGRAIVAQFKAMLGERDAAERHVRIAMRQVDEEASMLLLGARLADAAFSLGLIDVMDDLTALLQPYAHHVAVDSNAWWCEGPVSLTLALLAHGCGDDDTAAMHLSAAAATARSIDDARSLARIASLSRSLSPTSQVAQPRIRAQFTDREVQVMRMIVEGHSNPEIAKALSYSPSTIRNDASALYRKLGVKTRAEAAAKAIALGVV